MGTNLCPLFSLSSQLEWVGTACFSALCSTVCLTETILAVCTPPFSHSPWWAPAAELCAGPADAGLLFSSSSLTPQRGWGSPSVIRFFCPGSPEMSHRHLVCFHGWAMLARELQVSVLSLVISLAGRPVPAAGTLIFSVWEEFLCRAFQSPVPGVGGR